MTHLTNVKILILNTVVCTMSYTKITKSDKFGDLKYAYSHPHFCHFFVARDTNYLKLIFCTFMEYTICYIRDFFQICLELVNIIFGFFLKHQDHSAPNLHSRDQD